VIHQLGGNTRIIRSDIEPEIDTDNKATFRAELKPDSQLIFSFRLRSES